MDSYCRQISFLFLCLLVPLILCMDADNGGGNVIRDLPCVMRLNQLSCTGAGNAFPTKAIATFIDDNKALLRRMYGELQEPRTVTKTTFTIVRSFGHTSFVAAPLIQGQFASAPTFQSVVELLQNLCAQNNFYNCQVFWAHKFCSSSTNSGTVCQCSNLSERSGAATKLVCPKQLLQLSGLLGTQVL